MPRWARFLSCSLTGLLLSLIGFFVAAGWWEGEAGFWESVVTFLPTPEFWYTVLLFGLLATVSLLLGRIAVNLYGLAGSTGGFFAGGLVAVAYGAFLVSSHLGDWGGLSAAVQKAWPTGAVFAAPFALSGAVTVWLWDRLE